MSNQEKRGLGLQADAPEERPSGRSWFLGIGINTYENFSDLNNAVKDVQDLIALLRERYQLESDRILTLYDKEATRRNIIRTFDRLLKEVQPQDKLLIYYSGHGHLVQIGQSKKGFWIPTDAEKDNTAQYIRNSTIREYIEDINSLHTLLISDACFSGSLFVRGASRADTALDELAKRKSRWAICSGRHDEEVYDGTPGTNSPFAESILDILRTNQAPKLNVAKLADQVVELTRANYRQLPEGNPLYGVGHKGGQYIFSLQADEATDWKSCQAADRVQNYRAFLTRYPNSKHAELAAKRLQELEEEAAWEKATSTNTVLAYYQYTQQFPSGAFQTKALAAMKSLEEEETWQYALRTNQLSAFVEYKDRYPQGRFVAEAKERIQAILSHKQPIETKPPPAERVVRQPAKQEKEISRKPDQKTQFQHIPTLGASGENVAASRQINKDNRLQAILVLVLGWAVAAGTGIAIDADPGLTIGLAIGGLATGITLKMILLEVDWKHVFLLTLGWTIAAVIVAFVFSFYLSVSKVITVLVLCTFVLGGVIRILFPTLTWQAVLLFVFGLTITWGIGLALGAVLSLFSYQLLGIEDIDGPEFWAITGAVSGGLCAPVLFWQLRILFANFQKSEQQGG